MIQFTEAHVRYQASMVNFTETHPPYWCREAAKLITLLKPQYILHEQPSQTLYEFS